MNRVLVQVKHLDWTELVEYARVPVAGDWIQITGKGADKKVRRVHLLPFKEGNFQASIFVYDDWANEE